MKNITIVEYDPKYAAGVAEMWNKSSECWGGYNYDVTAENVAIEEANSTHLSLFLALKDETVLGYCKISQLEEDENALYIDLLNVIPEYHGKKVGKQLMLESVKKTRELGWPRVDLYTWPGNFKAVPLYKKCGFFWEKRDGGTHLMNFLPQILDCDLFKDFFDNVDWYVDSKRVIEIVKDGREERGFDFYNYHWEKDGRFLKIDICRRSRMISRIETDEYLLETSSPKLKHVFGTTPELTFRFVNKTDKPIDLTVKGEDNNNIIFDMDQVIRVESEWQHKQPFVVGVIDKQHDVKRTYPSVISNVTINGKNVRLGTAVDPLFPVELNLKGDCDIYRLDQDYQMFMNLTNNMDEAVVLSTLLPGQDGINLPDPKLVINLAPKEKKSIPIPFELESSLLYSQNLGIHLRRETGGSIDFSSKCYVFLNTGKGKFQGETDDFYLNGIGENIIKVDRKHVLNRVTLRHLRKQYGLNINAPKLGKPFTAEFLKHEAELINQTDNADSIKTALTFVSKDIEGIRIRFVYTMSANGMGDCIIDVRNDSGNRLEKDLEFSLDFNMSLAEMYLPYRNRIIRNNSVLNVDKSHWQNSDITGRWLFSKYKDGSIGLFWNQDVSLSLVDEQLLFAGNFGKLDAGESKQIDAFTFALHSFEDFSSFKKYYDRITEPETQFQDQMSLIVNDDNPFVKGDFSCSFMEHRLTNPMGELTLASLTNQFENKVKIFAEENKIRKVDWSVMSKADQEMDIIRLNCDLRPEVTEINKVIFPISEEKVEMNLKKAGDDDIHNVNNGVINFSASQKFGPLVFSLKYKNEEWLDSEYPEHVCRSWWNPWPGGIASMPSSMRTSNFLKENYRTDFGSLMDSKGNCWEGIKHVIEIEEYEKYKGLREEIYFLTQPGIPVLMVITGFTSNMGKFEPEFFHTLSCYLGEKGKIQELSCSITEKDGNVRKLYGGYAENWVAVNSTLKYNRTGRKTSLYSVINNDIVEREFGTDLHTCSNWNTQRTILRDGHAAFAKPLFYVFSEHEIKDEWFKDLQDIEIREKDNE